MLNELWMLDERTAPGDAAWNMAMDEALLTGCRVPILRLYGWAAPAVSFGYFLPWEAAAAEAGNTPLVRRWTGGGIVHHGHDETWSLILPHGVGWAGCRPAESYAALHGLMAEVLSQRGIDCRQQPMEERAPSGGLCFQAPAPGDLLTAKGKILGAGQRRCRSGMLHQASMQLPRRVAWEEEFASSLSRNVAPYPLETLPLDLARTLADTRYRQQDWTRLR